MVERFFEEESGQGMVEYGLIIALVGVALIAALGTLKGKIGTVFKTAGDKMQEGVNTGTQTSPFITGLF